MLRDGIAEMMLRDGIAEILKQGAKMRDIETLSNLLKRGQLSRRNFIAGLTAAGVGIATASSLADRALADSAPKRGGTLRVATHAGSTGDSLDPAKSLHTFDFVIMHALYNNLVELGYDKQPVPELAEEWTASSDAREWTFKLRQGIEFHNGKTLDSEDVRYSIGRHLAEDSESAAKGVLKAIESIDVLDKHTLKITLTGGNMDLPTLLTAYQLGIVPNGFSDWDNPVGTGGYTVAEFNPGVVARLARQANYWKPDRAWVDAVELFVVSDSAARMSSIQTGQVDVINTVEKRTADLLASNSNLNLLVTTGGAYQATVMRCDLAPFTDNNVRMAFKYGFPREEVLKILFRGYGTLGNDHPVPPNDPFFNSELPQRTFDPDKAKWHLKQAGLEGLSTELYTSAAATAEAVDAAVIYKERAAEAGLAINVINYPADGYWNDIWMQKAFSMTHWAVRPTPDMMFSTVFSSDASWNEGYWRNEQFDGLLLAARGEADFNKRKQMYWDMQEIVRDDAGNAIFMFGSYIDAYAKRVKGARQHPARDLVGCRIAEVVWLDDA